MAVRLFLGHLGAVHDLRRLHRRIVAHGGYGGEVRVALGDIDGDGRTDAALATRAGVALFYQRSGALSAPVLAAGGRTAADVALADVNADRRTDLVVSVVPGAVAIRLQTSAGVFAAPVTITGPADTGVPREQVFAADVNGDRRLDIAQFYGKGTWVRLQQANGSFAPASTHLVAVDEGGYRWPSDAAAVGDITGDGRADLVMSADANVPNSTVNVFAGSAGGPPTVPTVYPRPNLLAGFLDVRSGLRDCAYSARHMVGRRLDSGISHRCLRCVAPTPTEAPTPICGHAAAADQRIGVVVVAHPSTIRALRGC